MKESTRPLVCFDIETTGLDKTNDHIIQFAAQKFDMSSMELIDSLNLYIQPEGSYSISVAAYLKHKITPEFLSDKPHFIDVAADIYNFINDCDILTYNGISFDIPFLQNEFAKVGVDFSVLDVNCYDAFVEERRRVSNNQEDVFKRYSGMTMEEAGLTAHDAFSDIQATFKIFNYQQSAKEYDPEKMLTDDNFINYQEIDGKTYICFTHGKYGGVPVSTVINTDKGYINWCLGPKAGFSKSTKALLSKMLEESVK